MNRLDLCPLQSSYSASFGDGILTQDLGKGMPRTRADFIGAVNTASVSFLLPPEDYQYLLAFYRSYQRNPQPFLVGLQLDLPTVEDYICKFATMPRLGNIEGNYSTVSCDFVVKPKVANNEFDDAIIAIRNGGTNARTLNLLEELVNEDLPDALGEI